MSRKIFVEEYCKTLHISTINLLIIDDMIAEQINDKIDQLCHQRDHQWNSSMIIIS